VFKQTVQTAGKSNLFDVIDSYGTDAYHVGSPPDRRSAKVCRDHGVPVHHSAQKIGPADFKKFDYIIAMDESNLEDLLDMQPRNSRAQVKLFGEFRTSGSFARIVSDPYYGGVNGFEENFRQVTHFSEELLNFIEQR
jgi:low molecular weight phosphotyrosine protein phosphatase